MFKVILNKLHAFSNVEQRLNLNALFNSINVIVSVAMWLWNVVSAEYRVILGGTSSFGAQLAEAQVSEQVAVYAEKAVSEIILVSCTR